MAAIEDSGKQIAVPALLPDFCQKKMLFSVHSQ